MPQASRPMAPISGYLRNRRDSEFLPTTCPGGALGSWLVSADSLPVGVTVSPSTTNNKRVVLTAIRMCMTMARVTAVATEPPRQLPLWPPPMAILQGIADPPAITISTAPSTSPSPWAPTF